MPWAQFSEILESEFIMVRLCLLWLDCSCINPGVVCGRDTHSSSLVWSGAFRSSPTLCPASLLCALHSFCCYMGGGYRCTTKSGFCGSLLRPSYSHPVYLFVVLLRTYNTNAFLFCAELLKSYRFKAIVMHNKKHLL